MATRDPGKSEQKGNVPVTRPAGGVQRGLFSDFDRMFDQFMQGSVPSFFGRRMFDFDPFRGMETMAAFTAPRVDLTETDGVFEISAELPGLDEKDVEVLVENDLLTIRGEKSEEKTEEEKNYHLTERRYGSFQRSFRLPGNIDADKIKAAFDKGVLKITLPKTEESKPKKIAIGSTH